MEHLSVFFACNWAEKNCELLQHTYSNFLFIQFELYTILYAAGSDKILWMSHFDKARYVTGSALSTCSYCIILHACILSTRLTIHSIYMVPAASGQAVRCLGHVLNQSLTLDPFQE